MEVAVASKTSLFQLYLFSGTTPVSKLTVQSTLTSKILQSLQLVQVLEEVIWCFIFSAPTKWQHSFRTRWKLSAYGVHKQVILLLTRTKCRSHLKCSLRLVLLTWRAGKDTLSLEIRVLAAPPTQFPWRLHAICRTRTASVSSEHRTTNFPESLLCTVGILCIFPND